MEWSFDDPNGAVTVCQEGERAICRAICPDDRGGLWKAWLLGEGGKALLGTLIPEGGAMRLRRSIDVAQLERQAQDMRELNAYIDGLETALRSMRWIVQQRGEAVSIFNALHNAYSYEDAFTITRCWNAGRSIPVEFLPSGTSSIVPRRRISWAVRCR